MKAAVIGMGSMGWGAATSLVRAGIPTSGYDVVEEVVERFTAAGGHGAASAADAIKGADVVFLFVVNAEQVKSILFGSRGGVDAAELGTVFVINVTMSPADARTIGADLVAAGMQVIDAPTSGGSERAEAGEITIMGSGADKAFEKAQPALDAIAIKVFRLGPDPGTGSRFKMINQLLAGVHITAMAEAMVLAAREGMDLKLVHEVISGSAGGSWMFENRGIQIVEGDYTPHSAVEIFVKDMGIVTAYAARDGLELPQAETALKLFRAAAEAGFGGEADVSVAKELAVRMGVTLPGME